MPDYNSIIIIEYQWWYSIVLRLRLMTSRGNLKFLSVCVLLIFEFTKFLYGSCVFFFNLILLILKIVFDIRNKHLVMYAFFQ